MYRNRMYPFDYKGKFYLYDVDLGIVFSSTASTNNVIMKINTGDYSESMLEKNELEDQKEIQPLLKYIRENNVALEHKKKLVRKNVDIKENIWKQGKVLHKMWLTLTHACNMDCTYCFAGGGNQGKSTFMSREIAKECIDYFFKYYKKGAKELYVNFFGGEPLLNKDVFIFATDYINEKSKNLESKVKYLITTNGTVLDDKILEKIIENNMHVNISIDGSKETHNKYRKLSNGANSFDLILCNIKKIVNVYDNITARMTMTKQGIHKIKEDVLFLWNLGIPYVYFDVVSSKDKEIALDDSDLNTFNEQLLELIQIMEHEEIKGNKKILSNIVGNYEHIRERLILKECKYYNPYTIMFSPEGGFYKCNRIIGDKKHEVGNIKSGIVWNQFKRTFESESKCLECWAKRLCGGGCIIEGNTKESCTFKKIIIENSLKYYADLEINT